MRKLRDLFIWFLMFCKRLLKKKTFIVILLLIPLVATIIKLCVSDSGSILKIGLYNGGSDLGNKIVSELTTEDSTIEYIVYNSEEEAKKDVETYKIDGVWIFPKNLPDNLERNSVRGSRTLVNIIEGEETIPLLLSHEILYGKLHHYVCYNEFKTFMRERFGNMADTSEQTLHNYFYGNYSIENVIDIREIDTNESVSIGNDFLMLPLRGLLAVIMMLCGLASVMYFLTDKSSGRFDWMIPARHIYPAFGSCLAAVVIIAPCLLVSFLFLGIWSDTLTELFAMLLYMISVCGFCLVFCVVFRKAEKFGILIPFIMIITLVQGPIFFTLENLRPLRFLIPTQYYLYSLMDPGYMLYSILYIIAVYSLAFVLNILLNGNLIKKSR